MESKRSVQSISNGIFLGLCGLVVLIARTLLLNPVSTIILGTLAAVWGLYLLFTKTNSNASAIMSLIAAAALFLLGGLLRGLWTVAGIGLIVVGGISFFAGLLDRSK
jgi:hypothetical protein